MPRYLHRWHSAQETVFPDRRLVQWDCGKFQVRTLKIAGAIDHYNAGCFGFTQVLDPMLRRLKTNGHKVLIFTQMTKMLNVLEVDLFFCMRALVQRLCNDCAVCRCNHYVWLFDVVECSSTNALSTHGTHAHVAGVFEPTRPYLRAPGWIDQSRRPSAPNGPLQQRQKTVSKPSNHKQLFLKCSTSSSHAKP